MMEDVGNKFKERRVVEDPTLFENAINESSIPELPDVLGSHVLPEVDQEVSHFLLVSYFENADPSCIQRPC